jgi:hypothetical protein
MLLSGDKRSNAGVRNASSAPRQRSDHSSAARAGVGLDFLNFPTQQLPLEAWAHRYLNVACVFAVNYRCFTFPAAIFCSNPQPGLMKTPTRLFSDIPGLAAATAALYSMIPSLCTCHHLEGVCDQEAA